MPKTIDYYYELFEEQYRDLPCGGFLNPEIVEEDDTDIIFKCHYNNYESEPWYYGLDLETEQFYEA